MEPNTRDRRTKEKFLLPPQSYPWLLYSNGKRKDKSKVKVKDKNSLNFCSILDPTKTYSRSIQELGASSSLWTVQHGWCLFANKTKLFLWNPSKLEKIELPPLKHSDIGDIIFSCSPTASAQACSIFLFSTYHTSTIFYCQLGEKQWTEVDYSKDVMSVAALEGQELEEDCTYLTNPVYYNGCLYAESFDGNFLVVIEKLRHHRLKIKSACIFLPEFMLTTFDYTCKMIESNRELFRIEILHAQNKIINVVVHRLNFSGMVWEKVKSIKDRVFFISINRFHLPFACDAINPEMEGGRIYFPLEDNDFIYIYNIEDNSFMTSHPFSNLPHNRSFPRWFMQDQRMIEQTRINSVDVYSKETVDDGASSAYALPFYMVENMSENLNVIDYLNFRATSRAPPVKWRSFSSLSVSRHSWCPLFVSFEKDGVLSMAHPKKGLKYKYSINLPEDFRANYEICYSKDGWLLLCVNTISNIIFFNPFTREVKQLAYGPLISRNTRCLGFSHPPTSSECVVVQLCKIGQYPIVKAYSAYLGSQEWECSEFEGTDFPLCNMSPIYYKGRFYYISRKGKLAVLHLGEEYATWGELEKPCAPCTRYSNSFLVECNDSLMAVFEGPFEKWVRVFKLNESTMTWIKVESLGNHMLFVGNTSLSVLANIPGMENKIYFPRFYGQDIVFYSLETNKFRTFKNEVVNFHDVREKLNSSWIEPRWN